MAPPGQASLGSLLPPPGASQPFHWDEALDELVRSMRERIDAVQAYPDDSLRYWLKIEHVFHSSALAGGSLTLQDVQTLTRAGLTVAGSPVVDVLAAWNLAAAVDWVRSLAAGHAPLEVGFVRRLHGLVMRADDAASPGEYRSSERREAGAPRPRPAPPEIPARMEALAAYLASPPPDVDPLLQSAVVHAWLVGIFPFEDGNGRTARLVSDLLLLRRARWGALVQHQRSPEYFAALDEAHATGDLTRFAAFWLSCVEVVVREYEKLGAGQATRLEALALAAQLPRPTQAESAARVRAWTAAVHALGEPLQSRSEDQGGRIGAELEVRVELVTPVMMAKVQQGQAQVVARLRGQTAQGGPLHARARLGNSTLQRGVLALLFGPPGTSELVLEDGELALVGEALPPRKLTAAEAAEVIVARWLDDCAVARQSGVGEPAPPPAGASPPLP
jgi:Fic family protein